MRRPYHALALSGVAGTALPAASAFVVNVSVARTGVGRPGRGGFIRAGGPRALPPLSAGAVVDDGETPPSQRERRDSHPSAAM